MIQYFGTTLDEAGHYLFELSGQYLRKMPMARFYELPFNPEGLPHIKTGERRIKGTTQFYRFAGYSILAIEGSCYDTRGGTKSVFYTEQEISQEEFKQILLAIPIVQKMIEKMKFEVLW